jgi:hypothetical protein
LIEPDGASFAGEKDPAQLIADVGLEDVAVLILRTERVTVIEVLNPSIYTSSQNPAKSGNLMSALGSYAACAQSLGTFGCNGKSSRMCASGRE